MTDTPNGAKAKERRARTVIVLQQEAASPPPPGTDWLGLRELDVHAGLHKPSRRRDWRLGRWTAKRAIREAFGVDDPTRIELLAGPDGAPEVHLDGARAPVTLTLSHRTGVCLCLLVEDELRLGCDLEHVEPRSPAFVRDYLVAEEQQAVESARSGARDRVVNTIWSAKEAALKALHTGLRRDPRSVAVTRLDPATPGGDWGALRVEDRLVGHRFDGWWRGHGELVLTMVAEGGLVPPERLLS
ncbi:MAG: 4'-phosphopantetheinyl transferase family protein [Sandaracinaceae bacterium]